MAEFIVALSLIFSTAIFILTVWFTSKQKPSKGLPAGNSGLPFIGETLSFFKPYPANSMGDFMQARISRYGKIFSSSLLGTEAIVSADVELNRFVQNKDVKQFMAAWLPAFRGIFGKESLLFAAGESHKRLRSAYLDFLSIKRLQTSFLEAADLLASGIVGSWKDGSVISAKDESIKYSMQLMAKSTLSILANDSRMELLIRDFSHFTSALCSLPINFPGMNYWKALKARRNILKMVQKIIAERTDSTPEEHIKEGEGESDSDLLDSLLTKRSEYSDEAIEEFILNSIFAGHDTTSRAIVFMLYLLTDAPEVVRSLQEEHIQIVKSKSTLETRLSWEDYKIMEFTKCVINETLRLSSVASFIPKKALEDVKYKDIIIPQDCLVIVHMRSVHFDPSIYDNPMQFNPWRWMGPTSEKSKKGYMPFGGGARMCPGENLAKLVMTVFLHHIILNFEWDIAQQDHPMCLPQLEYPKGLPIRVHATQMHK